LDNLEELLTDSEVYVAVVALDHASVMRALPALDVGLLLRDDPVMSSTSSPVKFAE